MRARPAAAGHSGNGSAWEQYADVTFLCANSLILLVTSVVGLAANAFVIVAVYRQRSLQTSNNALVVNLAVVDVLRCAVDCPVLLAIVVAAHRRRHPDALLCDAQAASFSLGCCVQLLTLACISAERYQAVAQPFGTSQRRRRVAVLIPLTWTLAVLAAALCLVSVRDSPVHVRCKGARGPASPTYDTFGLYLLFPLWAACFGVVIGFYVGIFALVRSHNRKIFDKGTFPLPQNQETEEKAKTEEQNVPNGKAEQEQTRSKGAAQVEPARRDPAAGELTSTQAARRVSSSETKNKLKETMEVTDLETEQPQQPAGCAGERAPDPCATRAEAQPSNGALNPDTRAEERANTDAEGEAAGGNAALEGAVCMMPPRAGRERANKRREGKMAQRAGYIIVTFLLFWLPLVTTILVNFVVHRNRNTQVKLMQDVEILSVSVACVTSLTDPIIYAAVNPQFRTEFRRLKNKVQSSFRQK